MIDPKSLRIGNRLMRNGLMVTIDAKTIYDIAYYPDTIGNQYEAVALSPSLLERAGFRLHIPSGSNQTIHYINHDGETIIICNDGIVDVGGLTLKNIKHFHQLQNIFRDLTGQELELKP